MGTLTQSTNQTMASSKNHTKPCHYHRARSHTMQFGKHQLTMIHDQNEDNLMINKVERRHSVLESSSKHKHRHRKKHKHKHKKDDKDRAQKKKKHNNKRKKRKKHEPRRMSEIPLNVIKNGGQYSFLLNGPPQKELPKLVIAPKIKKKKSKHRKRRTICITPNQSKPPSLFSGFLASIDENTDIDDQSDKIWNTKDEESSFLPQPSSSAIKLFQDESDESLSSSSSSKMYFCAGCKQQILDNQQLLLINSKNKEYYHYGCFQCDQCFNNLVQHSYIDFFDEIKGKLRLCPLCINQRFLCPITVPNS